MKEYDPNKIEKKWQKRWEKADLYKASEKSEAPKAYILDMFPYPSGEGLHVGHVESYTATDIISRYLKMKGRNVLHPQGWDAFGLPAENYAIKTKVHPAITTKNAIANFTRQLKMMGFSYDWSREINSSDPDYYKWTQWFFLLLYKNGLAYRAEANVNWCESCQTVLANEQVENGVCERCKNEVKQKKMKQWFFKITDFIEDKGKTKGLISGLDDVDWPESTKISQKNWIGKSEGAVIRFSIVSRNNAEQTRTDAEYLEVFTTRLDTILGCTYCVVAPEHEIIKNLESRITNYDEVKKYVEKSKKKTELMRMEAREKTGVEIKGIKAINPFTNEEIPVFAADYVLSGYGTGAVMAVPAHDERDWEFAKKFNLPIKQVILTYGSIAGYWNENVKEYEPQKYEDEWNDHYTNDGKLLNSGEFSGMDSAEAREEMVQWLEKNKLGARKVNYKLRDWLISRQRYWGAPIPIIYCDKCGEVPVPEKDLPVELPTDVDFVPTGESPLQKSKMFHNVKCPKCGAKARRESDTMDTFVCSSWYYFRYADPKNKKEFAGKEERKKWLPVDLYVGGAEHTVLHLLYSRFFTKALHNLGYIDFDEPFLKLRHQGMILAEDGRKMSKSLGNVINPDEVVGRFGADSLRMYEMFMGPLEDAKPWNTNGIVGIYRFLERIWKIYADFIKYFKENRANNLGIESRRKVNQLIKKVTNDIENIKFNTAIAEMMKFSNFVVGRKTKNKIGGLNIEYAFKFLKLLHPFAPHITSELFLKLQKADEGKSGYRDISTEDWPKPKEEYLIEDSFELVIQINGKVRDKIQSPMNISEDKAKEVALESENVKKWIEGKEVKKIVFVKNRLINFITNN